MTTTKTGLRPYQQAAVTAYLQASLGLLDDVQQRRGLIVMPTGAGKVTVGLAIATDPGRPPGKVLWLEHREELAKMTRDRIKDLEPKPAVFSVEVCLKWLKKERVGQGAVSPFGLVIFNEAHHADRPAALELLKKLGCLCYTGESVETRLLGLASSRDVGADVAAIFGGFIYYEGPKDKTEYDFPHNEPSETPEEDAAIKSRNAEFDSYDDTTWSMIESDANCKGLATYVRLLKQRAADHLTSPTLGTIKAKNLGPHESGPDYRAEFAYESRTFQVAVSSLARATSAETLLLDVEVLRVDPVDNTTLVRFKNVATRRGRPQLNERIAWIEGDGVAWVPSGLVEKS